MQFLQGVYATISECIVFAFACITQHLVHSNHVHTVYQIIGRPYSRLARSRAMRLSMACEAAIGSDAFDAFLRAMAASAIG